MALTNEDLLAISQLLDVKLDAKLKYTDQGGSQALNWWLPSIRIISIS